MTKAAFTSDAFVPDRLVAGNAHLLAGRTITIATGQGVLPRGAVLGKITASGKYALALAAANDGSQVPDLVLAESVDATAADAPGLGYERGDFTAGALTLGTGHTVASIRDTLRSKGITLINSIPA